MTITVNDSSNPSVYPLALQLRSPICLLTYREIGDKNSGCVVCNRTHCKWYTNPHVCDYVAAVCYILPPSDTPNPNPNPIPDYFPSPSFTAFWYHHHCSQLYRDYYAARTTRASQKHTFISYYCSCYFFLFYALKFKWLPEKNFIIQSDMLILKYFWFYMIWHSHI